MGAVTLPNAHSTSGRLFHVQDLKSNEFKTELLVKLLAPAPER